MSAAATEDPREIRVGNYAAKKAAGFRCEGGNEERCEATDRLLVVAMRGSERGALGVYCEHHIDRRKHEVRPFQWDEAERLRERIR